MNKFMQILNNFNDGNKVFLLVNFINFAIFIILYFTTVYQPWLLSHYLFHDDSFYYFKIAENINNINMISFSGLTETNGFHPLWLFFLALTLFFFSTLNIYLSGMQASLILSVIIFSISLYYLKRSLNHINFINPGIVFFLFQIFLWRFMFDGMESALIILLSVLIFYTTLLRYFSLALFFLGLFIFARIDLFIIISISIAVFLFIITLTNRDYYRAILNYKFDALIGVMLIISLIILRYLIMPEQISSEVKSFWFKMYLNDNTLTEVLIITIKRIISGTAQFFWPLSAYDSTWFMHSDAAFSRIPRIIAGLFFLFSKLYFLILLTTRFIRKKSYIDLMFIILLVFSFSYIIVHAFMGSWSPGWQWYLTYPSFVYLLSFSYIFLSKKYFSKKSKSRIYTFSVIVFVLSFSNYFYTLFNPNQSQWRYFYNEVISNVEDINSDGLPIATWAAGHIGYFLDMNTLNLEGLVEDSSILQASVNDDISSVFKENNIKYVIIKKSIKEIDSEVSAAISGTSQNSKNIRTRIFKDLNYKLLYEDSIDNKIYSIIEVSSKN